MRLSTLGRVVLPGLFSFISLALCGQSFFNTGLNNTVFNLPCNKTCLDLPVHIPHIKGTSEYIVTSIDYLPYDYVTPGGTEDPVLYDDDKFSFATTLPFNFCFFETSFNKVVVGSNGLITFDETNAGCDNSWVVTNAIPFAGGTQCLAGNPYIPKAAILGAYSDLDPRSKGIGGPGADNASPADRKIEWRVEGTAPNRRFIASFYHIGVYNSSDNTCSLATPNTFQIVLYETTGIIEIYVDQKSCASETNSGRAIMGIQNFARNKAVTPPGKNNTVWTETKKAYRFTPSGSVTRYVSSEIRTLAGVFVAAGDTITTTPGVLDVNFPPNSICPVNPSEKYVITTVFSDCNNPGTLVTNHDTITVVKTNGFNTTKVVTPTTCGTTGTGSVTLTRQPNIGTGPYTYQLMPNNITQTDNGVFTGLAAGNYTVNISDATGCSEVVPFTITSTGALPLTFTVINTSCVGPSNGSFIVNATNGTAPFQYTLLPATVPVATNTFTNLAAGTYFVTVRDGAGCEAIAKPVTIASGPLMPVTYTAIASSCMGAANGSMTITPAGSSPFLFSINGGPTQTSNTFTGLQAGTYWVHIEDAVGCVVDPAFITVPQGTSVLTGTAAPAPTACAGVNNGSITITPTSGVGPYTYSINAGANWQASATFTGLAPGTYNVLIREAGMCISNPIPATVTAGSGVLATITNTPTTCAGVNNGSITVAPTNGTAPYTITLDGTRTQTTFTFNAVGAGAHSITITDANGCVTTAPLTTTVAAGSGYTTGFTVTPTSCVGVNNGSATITPQLPGSSPYTFVLTPGTVTQSGATNTTFNGLAPATYSVTVTDANGCQSTASNIVITQGAGLLGTLTASSTTCTGAVNGSIMVAATTGTGPYTITLDGTRTQTGAAGTTFINVGAGAHSVTMTDANGCTTSSPLTTTVAAGAGYTTNFTVTPTSCVGVNNGSITVTPQSPATSPYTFVMSPGAVSQTGATNTTFNGLSPATYSVLVTDASGCQSTASNIVVAQGAGLIGTLTSSATTCAGVNNGSITVTPGSGTAPFTMILDGTRTQTGTTGTIFTNVGAGAHSVMITDANGCVTPAALTTTVAAGSGYTTTATAIPTSCAGVANGSITVTPQSPGTSPYTFVMTPGAVSQTGAANSTFNGLAPATYSILVTDANGCQSTANNIVITEGAGLLGTLSSSATTCAGVSNGTITVTPGSGTAPYTMVLDGTRTQTGTANTIFTGVAAGSHSVTITDANGCITTTALTTTVASGTGYTTNFTVTGTTCLGVNNGSLTVTPQSPATSPYTFVLSPGGVSQTGAANTTFTGLAPGTYSVAVTDNNGCQSTAINMVIAQGAGLLANSTAANATCFGSTNGSITITPSNGTGPYTFVMNPGNITQTGATTTTFAGLAADTYTITMTDAAGCGIASPIVKIITQPAALTAPLPAALPVTCNGASNGTITIFPVGGTPPYTYSLDNVSFQNTGTFSVPQGTYNVFVKDANGCTLQFNNILVTQPAQLRATVGSTTNGTCNGGSDGAIQVTPTGGTAPYQYSLNGIDYQPSNTLNVAPGTYSVTVKDANSCTFVIPGIVVGMTDNLTLTMIDPPAICEGTSVELNPVTNANGFTWTFAGPASLTGANSGNPVASPKTTTIYNLTATLGSCARTGSMTVTVLPAPVPVAGGRGDICYGQNFQLQGSGGVKYTWSPATYLNNPNIEDPQSVKPEHTITYMLNVTDANNCKSVVPATVTVNVTPPIKVTSSFSDTVVYAGAKFRLQVASVGTDYVWTPATGLDNPFVPNPIVTAPATGDEVRYKVVSTTSAGCKGEKYITIRVYKGPEIYVVDAFTPNNDGKNETFVPFPVGIRELKYFRVFNRWGQLLFSTTTLNKGWDGRFAGAEQASGVYIWMIEGVTENGAIINKKGTVTLIR